MVVLRTDRDMLDSVLFFTLLDDEQRDLLLPLMQYRTYARRTYIIRAGEKTDSVHILVSGRAHIVLDDGAGREMILCSIGPNELCGELSPIDGLPRSASVMAAETCETICFPREAFIECVRGNPDVAMLLVSTLAARVRATDFRVTELAFADVAARVARVLLDALRERRGETIVEHSTEQLGRMVAASREMVSRIVRRLQAQGVIRRQRRAIVVIDRAALSRRAQERR
jgi:CRP/FNR family transcriptional regulator, cyclic AMP receptor protein